MTAQPELVTVCLLRFPVELHRRAAEHSEALRRELSFVEHAQAEDAAPARLTALVAELAERYGGLTQAQHERVLQALAAGEETIDLEYELPPDVVDAAAHVGQLLDELDGLCTDGDLLTMATPPDLLAYRRWFLREFEEQVRDGRAPTPWPGATRPEAPQQDDPAEQTAGAAAVVVVDDDLDLSTAPGLRKALVDHIDAGARWITVDLSRCEFMDSTGLSLLVTTHHRLSGGGGGLRLEGLTPPGRGVLEMAGATEFFGDD